MAHGNTAQSHLLKVFASLALACTFLVWPAAQTRAGAPPKRPAKAHPAPRLKCGDYLGFQVLLDRKGFSPGEIDGKPGVNFSHALVAFQEARHMPSTARPDCSTWHALGGETSDSAVVAYTITEDDVNGPFTESIPPDLDKQALLPALGYKSAIEELSERFHAAPALLQQLNPRMKIEAGASIKVPAVEPFDPSITHPPSAGAGGVSLEVSKKESSVRALGADGTVLLFAPVTTGSAHDPLPQGNWKVTGVDWMPLFNYNPALFWDAKSSQTKATLKGGPNNPVGVAWIGLTLEHYGLHGTPEPGHIGHAESHGCVRLTNWDAMKLASLVRPGSRVVFRE